MFTIRTDDLKDLILTASVLIRFITTNRTITLNEYINAMEKKQLKTVLTRIIWQNNCIF